MPALRTGVLLLACLTVGSCTSNPITIPEELVGVWATERTEPHEGLVVKGEAFYLTAHGTGFSMGSGPPPLGGSFIAWYDASSATLLLRPMIGQRNLKWEKAATYDPSRRALNDARHPEVIGYRRSKSIPKEVLEHRGPELWEEERARVRDLVRDMKLYFPRLRYREMSPKEEIDDQCNDFRVEALRFLLAQEEPALPSWRTREIESYRLIWIGASARPRPLAVRIQRDGHGDVTLATSGDDAKTGGSLTRRRNLAEKDWGTLQERLGAATYFRLPVRVEEPKPDVGWWIVEGWKDGTYQYVEACGPGPGPYLELCVLIMELGGLDPKLYERQ